MPDPVQTMVQPVAQSQAPQALGNPNTVYNVAPQGDAFGNWYAPAGNSSSIVQQLINHSYGRYPAVPPTTGGGGTTTPPVVIPPVVTTPPVIPPINGGGGGRRNGGGGGGGIEDCVAATSFLAPYIRASTVGKGFITQCYTPEEGFKSHPIEQAHPPRLQPCWRLVTQFGAALVCSESTPFTLPDGESVRAPAMLGQIVFVKRGSYVMTEKVVSCEFDGEHAIVPLGFGGRSFPAGESADAMIYSHNLMKATNGAADIARMRGILDGYGFSRESGFMEGSGYIAANPYAAVTVDPNTGGGTITGWEMDQSGNMVPTYAPAGTPGTAVPATNPDGTPAQQPAGTTPVQDQHGNWFFQFLDVITEPFIPGDIYNSNTGGWNFGNIQTPIPFINLGDFGVPNNVGGKKP